MEQTAETKEIFNHSNIFYIIISGMDGNYAYVNAHYAEKFRYIRNDFVGQPYHITMHPDDRETCREVAEKCFANPGKLFPAIIRKHDGQGDYIYTQWEYRALFGPGGEPQGIFCMGYNITDFVAGQRKLEGAISEVAAQHSLLSNIAFRQSHLLRAPLTNILSLATMLQKPIGADQLSRIVQMILDSAGKLDEEIRTIVSSIDEKNQDR
ncbi:PAS domain-containing protein [Pedobacter aquatilis]|uniref:PAS domain-containing protein n=1 Tax=Pedobacter aquatilis TaxID=351343 RepID=UPI00292FDF80|nr:PAS domain-containing protein [Pedobacter aquatilis]